MSENPISNAAVPSQRSFPAVVLDAVERLGNALPHPGTLFLLLSIFVVLGSAWAHAIGASAVHPTSGELVRAVNLLNLDGLHRLLTSLVTNFTGFAPLGTVFVAMLGIGLAESCGLLSAAMRLVVISAPQRWLTPIVVFTGIMSNVASEIGYVVLVPLAAILFHALGRHPLVGMSAAFAGVSGGYSANLLLGTVDPLLAGITQEAARIVRPAYSVSPACNYYFMAAATFLLTAVGTWVTERVIAPRLGRYSSAEPSPTLEALTDAERRGLHRAGIALAGAVLVLLWGTVPAHGFLRDPATLSLLNSPFLSGIVAIIFVLAVLTSIAYGTAAGTLKSDADVMNGMANAVSTLGLYTVLVFFAAQFGALFAWSNLGLIWAVHGAELIQALQLGPVPLMLMLVLTAATANLIMPSASAKWALLAPVFVPMLMVAGYTPEFTQAAFRIGDSSTNILSPVMTYFVLVLSIMHRYDRTAGIGTLVALMLPYSIAFLLFWTLLLVLWIWSGWPVGPGAGLYL